MSTFQINLNPLKEPLGFIKILEWFASIFAFATCGGFKGKTEIQVNCLSAPGENKTVTATFGYPFRLNQASFHSAPNVNVCKVNWEKHVLIGDYSSSAQFYVTFAVLVFLYCIAALLLYVGYTNLYRESRKLPMIVSNRFILLYKNSMCTISKLQFKLTTDVVLTRNTNY